MRLCVLKALFPALWRIYLISLLPASHFPKLCSMPKHKALPSLTHVMVNSADDLYSPTPKLAPTKTAGKAKKKVAGAKKDSVKYVSVFEAQPYGTYSNVAAMLDGADA